MKKQAVFLFLFMLTAFFAGAQKITGITFSYFVPITVDSFTNSVEVAGYTGQVIGKDFVSENPKTKAKLIALIKNLKANGTEDINKCFIPRHVVTLFNGEQVVSHILICFECDGIRFSNEKKSTKIKSVAKREQYMRELKKLFTGFHFDEKGIALPAEE